jgi:hypothetical protein
VSEFEDDVSTRSSQYLRGLRRSTSSLLGRRAYFRGSAAAHSRKALPFRPRTPFSPEASPQDFGGGASNIEGCHGKPQAYRYVLRQSRNSQDLGTHRRPRFPRITDFSDASAGVSGSSAESSDSSAEVRGGSAEFSDSSAGVSGSSTEPSDSSAEVRGGSAEFSDSSAGVSGSSTEPSDSSLESGEVPLSPVTHPLDSAEVPLNPVTHQLASVEVPPSPVTHPLDSAEVPLSSADVPLEGQFGPFYRDELARNRRKRAKGSLFRPNLRKTRAGSVKGVPALVRTECMRSLAPSFRAITYLAHRACGLTRSCVLSAKGAVCNSPGQRPGSGFAL